MFQNLTYTTEQVSRVSCLAQTGFAAFCKGEQLINGPVRTCLFMEKNPAMPRPPKSEWQDGQRRLLLLLGHSAESFNTLKKRLAPSPYLVTRLHLPHAIAVRLHMRNINSVILTPETAVTVGVAYPCRYDFPFRLKPWMLPGPRHRGLTAI